MSGLHEAIAALSRVDAPANAFSALQRLRETVDATPEIRERELRRAPPLASEVDRVLARMQREWPDHAEKGTTKRNRLRGLALSTTLTLAKRWGAAALRESIAEAHALVRVPFDRAQESYPSYELALQLLAQAPPDHLPPPARTALLGDLFTLARFIDLDRDAYALIAAWYAADPTVVSGFVDVLASLRGDVVAIQSAAYWFSTLEIDAGRDRAALERLELACAKNRVLEQQLRRLLTKYRAPLPAAKKTAAKKTAVKKTAVKAKRAAKSGR